MMAMGPTSYFYFNPDPHNESRQHSHFNQQFQQQMPMYPVVPTLPSTPIYSRPNSSCSQPPAPTPILRSVPSNLTPMASPQAAPQKPSMFLPGRKLMLETDLQSETDSFYYPSTPPLSSAGSNMGSPGDCDLMLSTPLNPMFSGLDGCETAKPEIEALPEPIDGFDWTASCASPPLTPGKHQGSIATLRGSGFRPIHAHLAALSRAIFTPSCSAGNKIGVCGCGLGILLAWLFACAGFWRPCTGRGIVEIGLLS